MSLTPGALTYTQDSFERDRVGYIGPDSTPTIKDGIALSRTAPKPTSVFSGVSRFNWKFTHTVVLTGALTGYGDVIFEVNVAVPVGTSAVGLAALVDIFQSQMAEADFDTFINSNKIAF
jgi:hypothetical protein